MIQAPPIVSSHNLQAFIDDQLATIVEHVEQKIYGTSHTYADMFVICFPINSMPAVRLMTKLNGTLREVSMRQFSIEVARRDDPESLLSEFPGAFRKLRQAPSGQHLHVLFLAGHGEAAVRSYSC